MESGDDPVDLDVRIAGSNAAGTITTGGKTLKVRVIGQSVYLQGDHQFWVDSVGPEVAKLLDGKWLKGSAADPKLKNVTEMTSIESVTDELLTPEGAVKRVKGRAVDGHADKPHPLLVVPDPGSDSQGRARFSDWDEKVTVSAPPAAEVVDVDKLAS
ncbi:MAG: hypothetical protein QOD68_607 [Actinomycetota bacterium]|nr:hypothetical protein [Actinomycetota bacterium]